MDRTGLANYSWTDKKQQGQSTAVQHIVSYLFDKHVHVRYLPLFEECKDDPNKVCCSHTFTNDLTVVQHELEVNIEDISQSKVNR